MDKKQALHYHAMGRPGKIEVVPTKPHSTQYDLSLAYSPGLQNLVWKSRKIKLMPINIPPRAIW